MRALGAATLVSLALAAAGCGGGSSGSPDPHTGSNTALAASRCMRSHGVRSFPDPSPGGGFPKRTAVQLGVSSSQLQAAEQACSHLLPAAGPPTAAALQQSWSDFRRFARCMRAHGAPTWPDPTGYPAHPDRPYFDLQAVGIDANSPQMTTTIRRCLPQLHGVNPQRLGQGGS